MKIEVSATIGIVYTKQVGYWYKRNGYYIKDKWVKPKMIRKFKKVRIKEPYLSGSVEIKAFSDLVLGGVYSGDNGVQYLCVSKSNISEPISTLRNIPTNLGKLFLIPKDLTMVSKSYGER